MQNSSQNIKFLIRTVFIVSIFYFISTSSYTQDLNFSQFYNTPISLNPANTGNHDYNWRFINNYRSQWRSLENPYTTIAVNFDHQYYFFAQNFSWSILYINDQSGDKYLSSNKFYASASYHYKSHYYRFHGGIQAGIVNWSQSPESLTLPDQWNILTGSFDSSLPTLDKPISQSIFYPDVNFGIVASRTIGRFEPELGIAIYHLNNPKVTFLKESNHLRNRNVFHLKGVYHINKKMYLEPWFVFMNHSKANAMLFGSNLNLPFPANNFQLKHFVLGTFVRDGINQETDAIIFSTGIKFNYFQLAVSYDYNVSDLKTVTGSKGAFEFSLIYFGPTSNLLDITIPCDRY